MYSSQYNIHLIKGLTTNESLFLSVLIESQVSKNVLQTVYMNLLPYISRVTLNKIKKNLIASNYITKDYKPLIDPTKLSEPMRCDPIQTTMGRPSKK